MILKSTDLADGILTLSNGGNLQAILYSIARFFLVNVVTNLGVLGAGAVKRDGFIKNLERPG